MPETNLFTQLLIMKRQEMYPSQRKATYKQKPPRWLYPYQYERAYARLIPETLEPVTELIRFLFNEDNIESWVQEIRGDKRQDGFADVLEMSIDDLFQKVTELFTKNSEPQRLLVSTLGFDVGNFNRGQMSKILNRFVGIKSITTEPWEKDIIQLWAKDNMTLIKGLAEDVIKKINIEVSNGVLFGKTAKEMEASVNKLLNGQIGTYKKPGYRAKLIARDQVGKLNGYMTERRQKDVGISMYEWSTAGDERVRATHKKMDNKICRWDDSSVMSRDGGKTWGKRPVSMQGKIPGSDYQCRCSSLPYMNNIYEEIDDKL